MERLTTLLDEDGDGRVSYRSLLGMLMKHLGDWAKRLPQVGLQKAGSSSTVHASSETYRQLHWLNVVLSLNPASETSLQAPSEPKESKSIK